MWIVTRSDWPILVNLSRAAQIGYQQIAKFDPRTRVIAAACEQEFVLADCPDGNEARQLVDRIAQALATDRPLLALREIDITRENAAAEHS